MMPKVNTWHGSCKWSGFMFNNGNFLNFFLLPAIFEYFEYLVGWTDAFIFSFFFFFSSHNFLVFYPYIWGMGLFFCWRFLNTLWRCHNWPWKKSIDCKVQTGTYGWRFKEMRILTASKRFGHFHLNKQWKTSKCNQKTRSRFCINTRGFSLLQNPQPLAYCSIFLLVVLTFDTSRLKNL